MFPRFLRRSASLHHAQIRPIFSKYRNSCPYATGSAQAVADKPPKPFQDMPALKGWPIIGDYKFVVIIDDIGKPVEDMHILKVSKQFSGTFRVKTLGVWSIVVQTPEAVEAVFRSEGKYPNRGIEEHIKGVYEKNNWPVPMGFAGDEEWKKIRSSASKQVVPRRVGNFVGPMSDIADDFIKHLESVMDEDGNVTDMLPEMSKWTFQSVSYFVYGEKVNTYSLKDPMQKEFFEAASEYVQRESEMAGAFPLYRIYPTKPYRHFVKALKRMKEAGSVILKKRAELMKDDIQNNQVDESKAIGLLDQWLIEQKFSEDEALSHSYDMLSAGIDTTSNSSLCLLYELARHPEIQDRLVREIQSVVGDKDCPSWEDTQSMPLLRNCVKEIMRLHTVVPVQSRVLDNEAIIDGYSVPAKTPVVLNMESIAKNEQAFDCPTEFVPDRWSKENANLIHPFSSLPFGFGPRACYGRRLAELEMYMLTIRLLPQYKLSTNDKELKMKYGLVCSPLFPLHLKLTKRQQF